MGPYVARRSRTLGTFEIPVGLNPILLTVV